MDITFTIDGVRFEDLCRVIQFMYKGNVVVSCDQIGSFLSITESLGMKWAGDVDILSHQNDTTSDPISNGASLAPTSSKKSLLPLKNITNLFTKKERKRKRNEKIQKTSKKIKIRKKNTEESKLCEAVKCDESSDEKNRLETDLARMDENTFCTTLGLKKTAAVRDVTKFDKFSSSRKTVPPLLKMSSDVGSKFLENVKMCEPANLCYSSPVYIEAKNLSFLNIDANELCIRENNFVIDCDVLNVTSHELLFDKENNATGSALPTTEGKFLLYFILFYFTKRVFISCRRRSNAVLCKFGV